MLHPEIRWVPLSGGDKQGGVGKQAIF